MPDERPIWTPSPERVARSHLRAFAEQARDRGEVDALPPDGGVDFAALHAWSVARPERFWPLVWEYTGVIAEPRDGRPPWDEVVRGLDRMAPPDPERGPRWFTGARLNFAENLLRYRDDREALVSWGERGRRRSLTHAELSRAVAGAAAAMRRHGIGPGDRVAGFLPNIAEAVIAMLATASLGAIWSSCSPDFGVKGVLDRFGQIEPRLLFAADGYRYAGKEVDSLGRVRAIAEEIVSLERVVLVPWLRPDPSPEGIRGGVRWSDWVEDGGDAPGFTRLPFDTPLYIMYSSGTTGLPKCMVHGAGGTLVQHLKEHQLHTDLRRDDRLFYFTTCGWMMWNWLVSGLATGATLVLYDGAPFSPRPPSLWRLAQEEQVTVFGTSARYLALSEKAGLVPRATHDLAALRAILSTGSPLAAASFDYVYRDVKPDVCLSSISGGTDIISCFALGNPAGPVWRGELQVRGLGMAVEAFDEDGRPVRGRPGELVCTRPFPSMPVAFWNDPDGAKYRAAYFQRYPGAWRHGDWVEITPHGGLVISGRSDATLNPGGVRIGTAEIYRQVEQVPEVVESVVIGQEMPGRDVRVVLFVKLRDGVVLDDALRRRIAVQIRDNASHQHVPKVIVQVADIPRTISGKVTELAVRDVVHGRPVHNLDALANPQALEDFRDRRELRLDPPES